MSGTTQDGLVFYVSEDAWRGSARFTLSVDGVQVGDIYTATASHAAGQEQVVVVPTSLGAGIHKVAITFINDRYGGTAARDRNLYLDSATYDGQPVPDSQATLLSNGTATVLVDVPASDPGNPPAAPQPSWQPAAAGGTEGVAIALGSLSASPMSGVALQSLVVSGLPVGDALSDGVHGFVATAGITAADVTGWNLAGLQFTPAGDGDVTLTATETDADGQTGSATEAVDVSPLAPGVAWSTGVVSGTQGSAIALGVLSETVNGFAGDANSLSSLTLAGLPAGASLSDGTQSFTATAASTSVSLFGWNLSALSLTAAAAGTATLVATATVQDANGDTSSASASEGVTVAGAVPSPPSTQDSSYADGSANAPTGTPILPSLLAGYAARPPWAVAGVDYAVGVAAGTQLQDPGTIAASGVSVNAANHTITVTGNNVTLNGYDFGADNGWRVIVSGSNDAITNSRFMVGLSQGAAGNVLNVTTSAGNFSLIGNEIDGADVAVTAQVAATITVASSGTFTMEYNYLHNSGGDMVDFNRSSSPEVDIVQYNVFENIGVNTAHADTLQWYNTQTAAGSDIGFNTVYQNVDQPGAGNGALVPLSEGPQATMSGLTVNNNTIIQTANDQHANWALGFYADLGGVADHVVIHDNYVDPTGAMQYTGSPWFATGFYHDNLAHPIVLAGAVNMLTGAPIPVPSATSKTAQGYYTYPDASGSSPALSDVYGVTASPSSAMLSAGATVTFSITMDETFFVGGTPTLALNDGETATYVGGSGTSVLTFAYIVGSAASPVSALAISRVNLPNGATVKDSVGNPADLSGAMASFAGLTVALATVPAPQPSWSAGSVAGTEGVAIALGSLSASPMSGVALQSLVVSGLPVGDALSDGVHGFVATAGITAADVTGWNLAGLQFTPAGDGDVTLTATETDADGQTGSATEAVDVSPLAPGVAWSTGVVSGTQGSAIALGVLSETVNGFAGDANSLSSLTLAGLPAGASLSDGTQSFTATAASTSVSLFGWNLSALSLTAAAAGTATLVATATVQDANGDTSSASASEGVTIGALSTPTGPMTPGTGITSGAEINASNTGPGVLGIASFTNAGVSGSLTFRNAGSASFIQEVDSSATYDGFTVNGPHLLIEGAEIDASIDDYASLPLVVLGSKIDITSAANWGIHGRSSAAPIYLLNSDISAAAGVSSGELVWFDNSNSVAFGNHLHNITEDGFQVGGGAQNVQITDNLVDQFTPVAGAHSDGIQLDGTAANLTISGNKIVAGSGTTSAINMIGWLGNPTSTAIDSNYLEGGAYALYGPETSGDTFTNNTFGLDLYPSVGLYGAVYPNSVVAGDRWLNNVTSDGRTVSQSGAFF